MTTNFKSEVKRKVELTKNYIQKPADENFASLTKYNLRRYNKRRHEMLIKIPEPPKAFDEKEAAL